MGEKRAAATKEGFQHVSFLLFVRENSPESGCHRLWGLFKADKLLKKCVEYQAVKKKERKYIYVYV